MADSLHTGSADVMELAGQLGRLLRAVVEAGGELALELRSSGPPSAPLERAIERFEEVTQGFSEEVVRLFELLANEPLACVTLLLERTGVPASVLSRSEMERLWRDFAAKVHAVCEDRQPSPPGGQMCRLTASEFAAVALIVNRAVQGRDLEDLASELGLWDSAALASAVAKLERLRAALGTAREAPDRGTDPPA